MNRLSLLLNGQKILRSSTGFAQIYRASSGCVTSSKLSGRISGRAACYINSQFRTPGQTGWSSRSNVCSISEKVTWQSVNQFHTSPRRDFHPLVWIIAKPVAKIATVITGRQFRKWWKELTKEEKRTYFKKFGWKILAALGLLGLFGLGNYYTHLQEAPITKRKRFIAFTDEQFMKICQYELEMHLEDYKEKIVDFKDPVYRRVQRVIEKLIKSNQDIELLKKQVWKIVVVQNPEANAFVMPTGHIFVHTGILNLAQNDDQLAVVLGHEISHAILGHGAEQVSFAQLLDVVVIVVMAGIWCFMPNDGIALVTQWFYNKCTNIMLHLPHSRTLEREADQVGLQLMAKACYDVRESSHFWNLMRLRDAADRNSMEEYPEYLSTHPTNESRASELDALLPQACDMRKDCNCPLLPSKDPRTSLAFLETMVKEAIDRKEREKSQPVGVTVIPVVAKSGG